MTHTVTLDREGLAINGQPLYMLAGQIHYFRYPKAEWRALLLTAKAGGINTVDTVIPWNMHEPQQGAYDFTEEADLAHFLDLCHELGLWAIVRPGPYICAEWENGGFPAWLTALDGIDLRLDNPVFLEHTLNWFDTLFPILTPRQVHLGGAIILCQIENEHWASGRYGHDDHQQTLAEAALAGGMDVPQYTCMGATRGYAEFRNGWSGIAEKLVATRALWPENPMIVSELWSGWFDSWGASRRTHKTAARFDSILSQLTAVGASGFSHWMWAGGTNFGYWGGRTVGSDVIYMTTSYDYDAPVTEDGATTEKFYVARRHHLFLATLGTQLTPVLADAVSGGPRVISPAAVAGRGEAGAAPYRNVRAGVGAPPEWQDFTATFLQNTIPEGLVHQVYLADGTHLVIEVEANTLKAVFTNMPLGSGNGQRTTGNGQPTTDNRQPTTDNRQPTTDILALAYHTSRILGFWPRSQADTLVLYGFAGEVGECGLRMAGSAFRVEHAPSNVEFEQDGKLLRLCYWITEKPGVMQVVLGERVLRVVLLTTERAERFWPLSDHTFLCGPDLVTEDAGVRDVSSRGVAPFYLIGADSKPLQHWARGERSGNARPDVATLSLAWTRHDVAELAAATGWRTLERPISMEKLDNPYGYGWYRAEFESAAPATVTLAAPGINDRARVILDGVDLGWLGTHPRGPQMTIDLALSAGAHDLRLLADNLGRFNYGSGTGEQKGVLDTLYTGVQHDITGGWVALWQEAVFAGEAVAHAKPWAVRADAANVRLDSFAFQGPSVWLLREFTATAGRRYLLHLTGDRSSGGLFVNGESVARFSRHYKGGFISADVSELVQSGVNVIALNILNYAGMAYRAHLLEYDPAQPLDARWSFCPGVTAGAISEQRTAAPTFFRATFAYDAAIHGRGPFRFAPHGLRKGQVWLNKRNIGRYWQIGPQETYKLPASWLQPENELLVFEEEGGEPEQAAICSPDRL